MISESDANQLPSFRETLIAFSNLFISPLVALDSVFDVGLQRCFFFLSLPLHRLLLSCCKWGFGGSAAAQRATEKSSIF